MKKALSVLLIIFSLKSYAITYTAISSGDFESASTWSPAGGPPGIGDNVIIPNGITVTVNTNNTSPLSNLYLSGVLKFTVGAKLTFNSGTTLQVNSGGSIIGGNGGSQVIFPGQSYTGPFSSVGPFYYTNNGSGSGILPVNLLYFKTKTTRNGVNVLWENVDESNVDYYELEWSDAASNWKTIFSQKPNNATTNIYSYEQSTGLTAKNYYRLKVIEKNSTFSYSDIIVAIKSNAAGFQVTSSVATNTVTCKMGSADVSAIKITDMSGKIISSISNLKTIQYSFNVSNLSKGIYFVTLFQNNTVNTLKFLKQ